MAARHYFLRSSRTCDPALHGSTEDSYVYLWLSTGFTWGASVFSGRRLRPFNEPHKGERRRTLAAEQRARRTQLRPITGYGEFIIDLEIPPQTKELRLSVSIEDSVLDVTTVQIPLLATKKSLGSVVSPAPTKHQTWAFASDGKALLMKVYPLNAFEIVRGLPAPLLVEVRDEDGQPISGALIQIGDCSQETDERGYVLCAMSSPAAHRFQFKGTTKIPFIEVNSKPAATHRACVQTMAKKQQS